MEPANRPAALRGDGSSRGARVLAARLVAVCSWLSLALCAGAWILLRAGDLWAPATALMFGPRWLLVLPPLFLIPLAATYRRRSLAPLLLTVILVAGPVMGFRIPWSRLSGSPAGPRLRVLTCNMHAAKVDPARLDELISETRPDVVALQLWRDSAHSDVLDVREWHNHRIPGLFLASRYPILRTELLGIDSDGTDGSVMRYELKVASGIINVFSLHFATPREGLQALAHRSWSGMAELDAGSALRREQSERLAAKAANATGPILLVGDFNTPPESAIFRRVWSPFTDAFDAAGWGWGYTFESRRVAVRIDHILMGARLRCDRCWVADSVGSPHRPVLADIVLPKQLQE